MLLSSEPEGKPRLQRKGPSQEADTRGFMKRILGNSRPRHASVHVLDTFSIPVTRWLWGSQELGGMFPRDAEGGEEG